MKKNWIEILIALVCLAKLASAFFLMDLAEVKTFEDYRIAENILAGHGYSEFPEAGPTALKAPFYPLLLSTFIFIFGSLAKHFIITFNILLFTLAIFLFLRITRYLFKEHIAKLLTLALIIYPSFAYYNFKIESTAITIPLLIIQLYFFIDYHFKNKNLCCFSLSSAILFLHQPLSLLFTLFYLFISRKKETILRTGLAIIILSSPWVYRNYITFDKLIITKSPAWMNIYVGMDPEVQGKDFGLLDSSEILRINSVRVSMNDVKREVLYKEIVQSSIAESPDAYFKVVIHNIKQFWIIPQKYLNNLSMDLIFLRLFPSLLLNFLTVYSLIILYRRNKSLFVLYSLFFILYTLPYALTHASNIRFKLDIEWLQILILGFVLTKKDN